MSDNPLSLQYSAPVDFRIGQQPPSGLPEATQTAFAELYSFSNQVIRTFTDYCGIAPPIVGLWPQIFGSPRTILRNNLNRLYVLTSEDIPLGSAVNLYNDAGTLTARKANAADNTKPCDGFSCLQDTASGLICEVILQVGLVPVGGVVIGQRYWLSTTSGIIANTPAVAAGNIEQYIGIGIDTTHVAFNVNFWLQH